ncbi:hypothetical protein PanWU01x14_133430 [Parasponia andersonii]|uniref:Uncharacterized protein n=1 Tax=Parasponia andersonii TaxID=3476 RepID=A0A2P5CPW2_PARAD|nr:hypothetical protein PanWU01x14_133430 [Parasponia andersonii]
MDGCMMCCLFDLSSLDYFRRSDKDVGLEKKVVAGFISEYAWHVIMLLVQRQRYLRHRRGNGVVKSENLL